MYGRSVVSGAINHTLAYPRHFDAYRRLAKTVMLELQPKDKRGYFMLPQAPEGAGYYVDGNVGGRHWPSGPVCPPQADDSYSVH